MLLDEGFKCRGKEFKLVSAGNQGIGRMYVFREVIREYISHETAELSEECMAFQVYINKKDMKIDAYNNSSHLVPYFRRFIQKTKNF